MKYVVGFMFSVDQTSVALIRKNKPAWQRATAAQRVDALLLTIGRATL